jgi:hypothetical protein
MGGGAADKQDENQEQTTKAEHAPQEQAVAKVANPNINASIILKTSNIHFSPSSKQRIYISHDDVTDVDVYCGREERGTNHPGNVFYRDIVAKNRPVYQAFRSKQRKKKTGMSTSIMEDIIKGRFIAKKNDDLYYLLTRAEVRKKVSQSLREKKPES